MVSSQEYQQFPYDTVRVGGFDDPEVARSRCCGGQAGNQFLETFDWGQLAP